MGTRADFYVGIGTAAEWIGSIGWDGYPSGIPDEVLESKTEQDFRGAVLADLSDRHDFTRAERGWPWPWEDSATTDYAYAFDGEKVLVSCFGRAWCTVDTARATQASGEDPPDGPRPAFPNMKDRQHVAVDARSGLTMLGSGPPMDIRRRRKLPADPTPAEAAMVRVATNELIGGFRNLAKELRGLLESTNAQILGCMTDQQRSAFAHALDEVQDLQRKFREAVVEHRPDSVLKEEA